MQNFKTYFIEKKIIGLIETIDIEGVGPIQAKVDSGNGAYCVLHGVDIKNDDNEVTFTTIHDKVITKPVVEKISINVGAGYVEDRPVVEFNVKIGKNTFNNVKFSIGNRGSNDQPVLLGKDFIRNSLDALIDVGSKDLASKNIEVNYK